MKKRLIFSLLVAVLAFTLAAGCEPAPDLNRPWNTATPQFAGKTAQQAAQPGPTSAPPAAVPTAQTGSGKTIEMAGAEDNPPFMYAGPDGSPAGLYPILIGAVLDRMGYQMNLKTYPWSRALAMGTNGEAPLAGIYKNEERLKIFDYSDAVYPNKLMLYVVKGKSFEYKDVSDLQGKSIGVMAGWTYGDAFDQALKNGSLRAEEVANDRDNFQKLILGRVDCIIAESTIADQIIKEENYTSQVEMLPTPVIVFDAYLVFAKSANQTELLETFNATLAEMKQDGSYDKLIAEWSGK